MIRNRIDRNKPVYANLNVYCDATNKAGITVLKLVQKPYRVLLLLEIFKVFWFFRFFRNINKFKNTDFHSISDFKFSSVNHLKYYYDQQMVAFKIITCRVKAE